MLAGGAFRWVFDEITSASVVLPDTPTEETLHVYANQLAGGCVWKLEAPAVMTTFPALACGRLLWRIACWQWSCENTFSWWPWQVSVGCMTNVRQRSLASCPKMTSTKLGTTVCSFLHAHPGAPRSLDITARSSKMSVFFFFFFFCMLRSLKGKRCCWCVPHCITALLECLERVPFSC